MSRPLIVSLSVGIAVSVLVPAISGLPLLIAVLVVGTPFYGSIFAPASAMVAAGAQRLQLNQGIAFSLSNLTWAAGQAVAASGGGALAEATSDLVPYLLVAIACLATLARLVPRTRAESRDAAESAGSVRENLDFLSQRGRTRGGRGRGREHQRGGRQRRQCLFVRERDRQLAGRVRVQRRDVARPLDVRV
jgi:MFS family permease